MPRQTTAIVLVAPNASGPWGDPLDQPTHVVRFTENSVPGWQVHPLIGAHGTEDQPTLAGTSAAAYGSTTLAHELVVLIAAEIIKDLATLADPAIHAALRPTSHGGGLTIPDAGFPDSTVTRAAAVVADQAKLWLIPLRPQSMLLEQASLAALHQWGVDVHLVAQQPLSDLHP